MLHFYKLAGHRVVKCQDAREYLAWIIGHEAECQIRLTKIGAFLISTSFLPMDHNFSTGQPAVFFETKIFLDATPGQCIYRTRCATYDEAIGMHVEAIAYVGRATVAP